jgi:aspartyl-tRNA(Asn)/glutamyl-tRNA(Gln) amidotransferase subunit C
MKLTSEQIEHIAHLARLSLKQDEKEKFRDQLSSILDYFDKLTKVDTKNAPIISQITGLKDVAREDEVRGCDPASRKLLLENMPIREGDLLKVRAVFE